MKTSYELAREIALFLSSKNIFGLIYLGTDQKNDEDDSGLSFPEPDDPPQSELIIYPISSIEEDNVNEVSVYFQYAVECSNVVETEGVKMFEGLEMLADLEKVIYDLKFFNRYSGNITENEVMPVENFPFFMGYTVIRYNFPITIR